MSERSETGIQWTLISQLTQKEFPVEGTLSVGRSDSNDIQLKEGNPSRKHAQITVVGGELFVEDLGSTNGTFVNGMRIDDKVQIGQQDVVKFDVESFFIAFEQDQTEKTIPNFAPAESKPEQQQNASSQDVPQSWAVERTKSVDSTMIMSDDMLDDLRKAKAVKKAAANVEKPTLLGLSDPITDQQFILEPKGDVTEWKVGRSRDCDIFIDHDSVSNDHAVIVNEGERWKVIDSMSANGTFVDGKKALTSYLTHNVSISFGQVESHFLLAEDKKQKKKPSGNNQKNSKLIISASVAVLAVIAGLAAAYFLF